MFGGRALLAYHAGTCMERLTASTGSPLRWACFRNEDAIRTTRGSIHTDRRVELQFAGHDGNFDAIRSLISICHGPFVILSFSPPLSTERRFE